jgi:aspartate/glutamate racemase
MELVDHGCCPAVVIPNNTNTKGADDVDEIDIPLIPLISLLLYYL